jgi:RNA-directed DNA polymerase
VPTNFPALRAVYHHVTILWLRTLQRRSQKDRTTWQRIAKLTRSLSRFGSRCTK